MDVPVPSRTDPAAPGPVTAAVTPAAAAAAADAVSAPAPDTAIATDADVPVPDEAHRPEVLEALEADLAAVEEALATLDRITAEGGDGAAAAAQVAAVVSAERFPDPPTA